MQETKGISAYKQGLRSKILEQSMRDFAERGIRAVKMDDVAAELGISKRTLYEVFENKELLLFEGLTQFHKQRKELMKKKTESCKNVMEILLEAYKIKVDEFRTTNPHFYADLAKYPKVLRFLNQENLNGRKSTVKFLERGVSEGYFRDDCNLEMVAKLLDAMIKYVMVNQLYRIYTMEDIFKNIVLMALRGISTDKGIKGIERLL